MNARTSDSHEEYLKMRTERDQWRIRYNELK
jgi:hypothetical protein